jgi:hypothetical protein
VNGNGIPDECDCLGDVDGDFDVDLDDLTLLLQAFGACSGEPDYVSAADADDSGCIDLDDLTILLQRFGQSCP